ncbi:response regulator [Aquimarina sp. AU474]|uniref:response regulator n=1 Tax=Aquimarina sp. AU474 TaxID=2108529 RepID=UPI0013594EF6|nr:response regulator [Aquimarina sp. AU474]
MVETVLLIDDNKATLFIQKKIMLQHDKFRNILTFSEGSLALEYLKMISVNFIKKPQLILLDLNMPSMNGWEFIEQYNQLDNNIIDHTRLVVLTTSHHPENISRSKNVKGINEFMEKPLSKPMLDRILENYFMNP